jgi:hypothetical protein
MMKRIAFTGVTFAALAACAQAPEPQPDPALIERVALASTQPAETPKLDKPDRLAGAAERLLAR